MCNKSHILVQWTMAESEQFHFRAMSGQPMVGCEWPCTIPITRDIQIMLNYFMPVDIYMHLLISQILIQTANQHKFDSLPLLWPLPLFGGIQGQQQHNLRLQPSNRIS